MIWIVIGVGIVVALLLLQVISKSGAQDYDEEAMKEAAQASPKELDAALHPPPKTKEEIEEETDMYSQR